MYYVGVDVSCDSLEVYMADTEQRLSCPNTTEGISVLLEGLDEDVQVILEPTSSYHHLLIEAMKVQGVSYSLVNPKSSSAYAKVLNARVKTDKADARMLAMLGQTHALRPSEPIDSAQQRLKAHKRHLEWLNKEARAARNRLATMLRSPWTPQAVIDSMRHVIEQLDEEVQKAQEALDGFVKEHDELESQLELLTSIPGVGRRTAIVVLSEMPSVTKCKTSKQWVAFCGLNPELRQSGKSSYSRLSRMGGSRIRPTLYMAAITAVRFNPLVQQLAQRLKSKGKAGKLVLVAAMNKLIRLCFGVLRSGRAFDLSIHQQA